ncbi:MAG TPA: ATP12 family protein [Dongiaceae bacterium]|jgi:chaperone required for assembly of F1-ATPase|nr:ATP12 family protein [Dongiaceae bacterium]
MTDLEVVSAQDGWLLLRKAQPLLSPKGRTLLLPALALAESVAAEWCAQGARINPLTMPFYQFCLTTLDIAAPDLSSYRAEILKYGASDLLCYWASDPRRAERQQAAWEPYLDWAARTLDAPLDITRALRLIDQPALPALERQLEGFDPWRLTGLSVATQNTGSLVLALALYHGVGTVEEIHAAACLDEIVQEEQWGRDELAYGRRAALLAELKNVARFWAALGLPPAQGAR